MKAFEIPIKCAYFKREGVPTHLVGFKNGLRARGRLGLGTWERLHDKINIVIPDDVHRVTPSYLRGLLVGIGDGLPEDFWDTHSFTYRGKTWGPKPDSDKFSDDIVLMHMVTRYVSALIRTGRGEKSSGFIRVIRSVFG